MFSWAAEAAAAGVVATALREPKVDALTALTSPGERCDEPTERRCPTDSRGGGGGIESASALPLPLVAAPLARPLPADRGGAAVSV